LLQVFFGVTPGKSGKLTNVLTGGNTVTAPLATLERQSQYAYVATSQAGMQTPPDHFLAEEMRGKGFAASEFEPQSKSSCWRFYDDTKYRHKDGWICDQESGGEKIVFALHLAAGAFTVRIGYLRSYEGMGKFRVVCTDEITGAVQAVYFDGLWGKKTSVYDEHDVCTTTGNTSLAVETLDVVPERTKNIVKTSWESGVLGRIKGAHEPMGNKVKLLAVIAYRA
jgi:hypothetical protein